MREFKDSPLQGERLLPESNMWLLAYVVIALDGVIFDFITPPGAAGGVIYIIFVLTAFWWRSPDISFLFASIASGLIIFNYLLHTQLRTEHFLAGPATIDQSVIHLNIALSTLSIWVVAGIVYFQKKTKRILQKSEETLRAIRDGTVDGIISTNRQGIIESYNQACESIFGFPAEEAIGQNIKMLTPLPIQENHDNYISTFKSTGKKKVIGLDREVLGLRKDGTTLPIDLSVSEINANGERMFCGIVRDITDRKQAEADKERFILQLAHSNRELDNFAYVASHDLKAPLRVISNAADWLQEDLGEKLDEECQEHMDLIQNRVKRMEQLLDDLLQYSQIGRQNGSDDQSVARGDDLIQETLLLANIPSGFTIDVAPAFADISLKTMPLKVIFSNLINNAIKHHDRTDGIISIDLDDLGDKYAFTVSDDGPGIDPKFHEQVFSMFKTLKPRDHVEGSGMGLAMIEKHIKHFGEDISLVSAPGQGSHFRFTWSKNQTSLTASAISDTSADLNIRKSA